MFMPDIRLSILIPGITERRETTAKRLLRDLETQVEAKPVEVIYLCDNKKMTCGRKRDILLQIAQGEYLSYIDDDDTVAPTYVSRLLAAIDESGQADVICFRQECTHVETGYVEMCEYSLKFAYSKGQGWWKGKPAHTMCWKTETALKGSWPDAQFGEDMAWVEQVCAAARTEHRIDDILYFYRFDHRLTATRG